MDNMYLIPANSKKSMLLFGLFTKVDLALFLIGVGLSLLLLLILPIEGLLFALIALAPGVTCAFLVFPVPNYHNIRTIIKLGWDFYTTRQKYIWRGWCYKDGEEDDKK